jgi:hypothetical protein
MKVRNFSLDEYTTKDPRPYEFNWNDDYQGWTGGNIQNLVVAGGILKGSVPGPNSMLWSPAILIDSSVIKKVVVRMYNKNPAGTASLFWKRSGDAVYALSRRATQSISGDGAWHTYTFDMTNIASWNGKIVQVRLDPILTGANGEIGINYIRFSE